MQEIFFKTYPNEIFKEIEWSGVKLLVGNMGTIKDENGIYKPQNKTFKYNRVSVGGKHPLVHRIVATAFIPNPEGCETVNHINGDRRDNRAENLEWCTREQNSRKYHGEDFVLSVAQYNLNGDLIAIFKSRTEAGKKTGIKDSSISACCAGKRKTAGSYVWKPYKPDSITNSV